MQTREYILLNLVRSSLWGTPLDYRGRSMNRLQYKDLMELAEEQTVVGLVAAGLMTSGVKLDADDVPVMYAQQQVIRRKNAELDEAVVALCQNMSQAGIRIVVMKGQTLAALYPDAGLRQSGDIDFYCHPDDWDKAIALIRDTWHKEISDYLSVKHVEFDIDGIQYEMHCMLTNFARPRHQRYWDEVVVPSIWDNPSAVRINGYEVPRLYATCNVLYTFVHIFYHLILEGIGLRQFIDLAMLLTSLQGRGEDEMRDDVLDVALLEKHLEGLGLKKAFMAVGAVLTEHLGMSQEVLPFALTDEDKERGEELLENVLERGNFGHNVNYVKASGPLHGLQHLFEIAKQTRTFYHYAPSEVPWRILDMFKWWGIKIWRMALGE